MVIGRPEAIFSAFFLWGIFTQFTPSSSAYKSLLLFWAIFLIINTPKISNIISVFFESKHEFAEIYAGQIRSFSSPRVFEFEIHSKYGVLSPGTSVTIHSGDDSVAATGVIIDDCCLNQLRIAKVAVKSKHVQWHKLSDNSSNKKNYLMVTQSETTTHSAMIPVGTVGIGSNIGTLRLLVNPDVNLVEGEVLSVELGNGNTAYYQIVEGTVVENTIETDQKLQEVNVSASQLGVWDDSMCRFETVSWVAPAGELVYRLYQQEKDFQVPEGKLEIGKVPNSAFPVHVNLDDIVTHNTSLIGVTGSGKSYLCLWLIEGLINSGVRILVLDISRQHYMFLKKYSPYSIEKPQDVDVWLATEDKIGIHQYAMSESYPKTTADIVQKIFQHLENTVTLRPGTNEPAKICVILEEAHSLIPEWNQVAQTSDTAHVNKTARTILQGRKYGFGCIVVSQRTANVTKTILNQCNTIIALQSFDQTGLDFLSNYMGKSYANVISTLPSRHAVIVGKASSSARPILFCINNMGDYWTPDGCGCTIMPKEEVGVDSSPTPSEP